MYPFSNHKKYSPEELMVIMTDEKDHIIEISRSVKEITGINSAFVAQNAKYISEGVKIDQIINIDLELLEELNKTECVCTLNNDYLM